MFIRRVCWDGQVMELHSDGPDYRYWRWPMPLWFWTD